MIDAKCLVFPQQRGFDWCEVPSFAQQRGFDWYEVPVFPQQRGFDWYEAKYYVSPSNAVLIDAAILYGTDTEFQFLLFHPASRAFLFLAQFLLAGCFYSCATLDLLTACLFKEIDAQICLYIVYTRAFYH